MNTSWNSSENFLVCVGCNLASFASLSSVWWKTLWPSLSVIKWLNKVWKFPHWKWLQNGRNIAQHFYCLKCFGDTEDNDTNWRRQRGSRVLFRGSRPDRSPDRTAGSVVLCLREPCLLSADSQNCWHRIQTPFDPICSDDTKNRNRQLWQKSIHYVLP